MRNDDEIEPNTRLYRRENEERGQERGNTSKKARNRIHTMSVSHNRPCDI